MGETDQNNIVYVIFLGKNNSAFWSNIAQVSFICNFVPAWMILYYIDYFPHRSCPLAMDQHCASSSYYVLVDFLLTTGCWKFRGKIVQIWPTLCKKIFGTSLHKKTRFCGTIPPFHLKQVFKYERLFHQQSHNSSLRVHLFQLLHLHISVNMAVIKK